MEWQNAEGRRSYERLPDTSSITLVCDACSDVYNSAAVLREIIHEIVG